MLPMLGGILSSSQSCGLADAAPTGHAYRTIRGRCCVIGGRGPAPAAAKANMEMSKGNMKGACMDYMQAQKMGGVCKFGDATCRGSLDGFRC